MNEGGRLFSDLIGALRPKGDRWRGCLMGDFTGNVDAPIDGWKYVRIPIAGAGDYALGMFPSGGTGGTEYNTPVLIEYDPINHQRIIAGADSQAIGATISGPTIPDPGGFSLPAHSWTQQLGGNDQLIISREQLGNLQISPSTTARHVAVSGGVCVIDGVLIKIYLPLDVDLTAYYPANGVKYIWLTLTAAGAISVIDPAVTDITALTWPGTNNHVLGFVMLKALLTTINWGAIKSLFDVVKGVTSYLPAATTQYQVITSGPNPYPAAWSTFLLGGTAGGKTVLAVTNAKMLTLTATDDFNLTIPKTGTAVVGTGTVTRLAEWVTDVNTLQASTLIKTGTNTLTLATGAIAALTWTIPVNAAGYLTNDGAGAFSYVAAPLPGVHNVLDSTYHGDVLTGAILRGDILYGNITSKVARLALGGIAGSVLTRDATDVLWSAGALSFAGAFTLTVPATGTAALLGTANVFTANQTISNAAPALILTDTTGAAKSLTIAVDANVATLQESAAGVTLLSLDLANNRVGVGNAYTTALGIRALNVIGTDGVVRIRRHADASAAAIELLTYDADGTTLRGYWDSYVGPSALNPGKFVIRDRTVSDLDRLTIDTAGYVGIGNTAPQLNLHVGDGADAPFLTYAGIMANVAGRAQVSARNSTGNTEVGMFAYDAATYIGAWTNHDLNIRTNNANRMTIAAAGAVTIVGAFGCNAAAAQTAYASGGALAAYATGAFGLNSDANMSALHAMVVKIRAALVANGIMS